MRRQAECVRRPAARGGADCPPPAAGSPAPPGMRITAENLARIERAEQALFTLGFRDFRVRQRGDTALLQLPQAQLPRALEQRKVLLQALRAEFSAAVLDLEARDE